MVVVLLTGCAIAGPAAFWIAGTDEKVPSYGPSMLPTLSSTEPLDIDFEAYETREPRLEEIVALQGPPNPAIAVCARPHRGSPCGAPAGEYGDEFLIKRIVAGPGDEIAIALDGRAILNGTRLEEPYIRPCRRVDGCGLPVPATIPPGHWFVMGDNRRNSTDSRFWGPVPLSALEGQVLLDN
jgi:signal peptidase I